MTGTEGGDWNPQIMNILLGANEHMSNCLFVTITYCKCLSDCISLNFYYGETKLIFSCTGPTAWLYSKRKKYGNSKKVSNLFKIALDLTFLVNNKINEIFWVLKKWNNSKGIYHLSKRTIFGNPQSHHCFIFACFLRILYVRKSVTSSCFPIQIIFNLWCAARFGTICTI